MSFITTQLRWKESTDVIVKPNSNNGLKQESLLRLSKLATIDSNLVVGILGELDSVIVDQINENLIIILKLN